MTDNVNHPKHYNSHPSGIECLTIVRHFCFNLGNVIKYIWRYTLKEGTKGVEDLEKAAFYLADEIRLRREAAGLGVIKPIFTEGELEEIRVELNRLNIQNAELQKKNQDLLDVIKEIDSLESVPDGTHGIDYGVIQPMTIKTMASGKRAIEYHCSDSLGVTTSLLYLPEGMDIVRKRKGGVAPSPSN